MRAIVVKLLVGGLFDSTLAVLTVWILFALDAASVS